MLLAKRLIFAMFLLGLLYSFARAAGGPLEGMGPLKAVVFEDDFESDPTRSNPKRWEGISPAWQVMPSDTRGIVQEDTRPITRQVLYSKGFGWKDYSFLCRLRIARWGGQTKNFAWSGKQYRRVYWAVALRVRDAANGYRLEYAPWVPGDGGLKQSFYRIVKYTGGRRTELARVFSAFHSELDYLVRFEVFRNVLRAKIWPADTPEPGQWTVTAVDSDHAKGTVSFLTANASVLFGGVQVKDPDEKLLLKEDFAAGDLPDTWQVLSGTWRCAPWGQRLVRSIIGEGSVMWPARRLTLPAEAALRFKLSEKGVLNLSLDLQDTPYQLILSGKGAVFSPFSSGPRKRKEFSLDPGREYTLRLRLESGKLELGLEPYPCLGKEIVRTDFELPGDVDDARVGLSPFSSGVSLDDLALEATVPVETALKEYLRYICEWYMDLELPGGYPKAGTGSPELFIASYCTRTLMAGGLILKEPAYLEEALRWADYVCSSPSVLVPLITGSGREALALRTFADWSACINMADIGSVLLAVGVLSPWGDDQRRARYLEVMEKYSLYVIEGCLEDPLILGRGYRPQGWRIDSGPDRGGIINGYWWMDRNEEVWDISTTNAGLQFYSVLYALTGNSEYRIYAREATDWYLEHEIETGGVFEALHDVVYGGEALITAFEHSADGGRKSKIDKALGKLCRWIVEKQNADGTWNQADTPRNNRSNLVWSLLNWYGLRHPEDKPVRQALQRTLAFHLDRSGSRAAGVCEVLRKSCFTGVSVAELIRPGITVKLRKPGN